MTLGLSQGTNTGRVSGGKLHESNVPKSLVVKPYRRETIEIKSHPCTTDFSKIEKRVIAHMTDEMIEREAKAQKEIQKKKNRVGILVNKSGYQYISDGMDPKTLGRK
jgi:predicted nucleic acid-binding Zn ribbon protein